MKRSSATSSLEQSPVENKRLKVEDDSLVHDTNEYLQLILTRITDLQKQISQGVYVTDSVLNLDALAIKISAPPLRTDNDLLIFAGEPGEPDAGIMKEVLTKVFKDVPETSRVLANVIDSTSKPTAAQVRAIRNKRHQLSGFEACRKIATRFVKSIVRSPAFESVSNTSKRCDNTVEVGEKIAEQLDLHLAVKQRDYTARLMRE